MLEILLQEWSESKLGSEPRAALDKSVCALLEHPHADFDETCAMILMQTYKYESGLNRLLEKLNMYVVWERSRKMLDKIPSKTLA